MDYLHQIVVWIKTQNWFVLSFAIVGWLNVIVAGAKAMGWTLLADFCSKLEEAIQAMVSAALNKNKTVEVSNVKTDDPNINSNSKSSSNM